MTSRDTIVSLFTRIDRQDWQTLAEIFSEDVTYERPGYNLLIGRDRVLQFYREERVVGSGVHELHHIIIDGEIGACCGQFTGVHKDGSPIDIRFADVYQFEQRRIKRRTSYFFRAAV